MREQTVYTLCIRRTPALIYFNRLVEICRNHDTFVLFFAKVINNNKRKKAVLNTLIATGARHGKF